MKIPDKLTITLSEKEKGDIGGWVNFLKTNPQYIGVPGRVDPNNPKPVTWQTRIVLDEQTRARFEEIASQFGISISQPQPPLPPDCPVKLDIQPEFTKEERLNGQNVRVVQMWKDTVLVIPVRVPMPKDGVMFTRVPGFGMAICEFTSPPTFRQATLSKTPGDFGKQNSEGALLPDPSVLQSGGLTPNIYTNLVESKWTKPGELLYFNVRFWMNDYDTGKGKTTVQADQYDKAQTSRFSAQWPTDN